MPGPVIFGLHPALFKEGLPQIGERIRHQFRLLVFRSQQNKVGEAFGHSGRQLGEVGAFALHVLLHKLVDVAVQAIAHMVSVVTDPVSSISLARRSKSNGNQFGRPPKAAWTWAITDFGVLRTAVWGKRDDGLLFSTEFKLHVPDGTYSYPTPR